jgi:hypothetical protein
MKTVKSTDLSKGYFTDFRNERYYCIDNYDRMDPFFMTLTSPSDHWLFISSSGGLTAGRKDSDSALFPYYTVDKVTENRANTGGISLFHITLEDNTFFWKPFDDDPLTACTRERKLYKNVTGNSLIFQEILLESKLIFEVEWTTSPQFGVIRRCRLRNSHEEKVHISLLDGVRNVLPAGVTEKVQLEMSSLLDAYKRSELIPSVGLGVFSLSATLTDKAEPSESLWANTWCQSGLENVTHLLSENQVRNFIVEGKVESEEDIKGYRGAYLIQSSFDLAPAHEKEWFFCGEVHQDFNTIESLIELLKQSSFSQDVERDLRLAKERLQEIVGKNDGIQMTGNELTWSHHFTNVMFNVMRGGYFANGYNIDVSDFSCFVQEANKSVYKEKKNLLNTLEDTLSLDELERIAEDTGDIHFIRLVREYLPVTFSRRHGDPSRPWNKFSLNTENLDGTPKIDFQGNWRDIFQNWEALLVSNPRFVFSIISKFLNATGADGYNPYRISRSGIDWERPEPENPWSNIGYWSDHQIIYLLKLMELAERYFPGRLNKHLLIRSMVHANVPYEIRPYSDLKRDPQNSIIFKGEKDSLITQLCAKVGSDGRLLHGEGEIVLTHMLEKLMILLLAKCTNFIPDGGIWMNTQRPEWNDANNALVGEGISVVTLSYLVRYLRFLIPLVEKSNDSITLTGTVFDWMKGIEKTFVESEVCLTRGFTPLERSQFVDSLGEAGGIYRQALYTDKVDRSIQNVGKERLLGFLTLVLGYFEATMRSSFREDGLLHSYNRIERSKEGLEVGHFYEMLEGQVAGISSNMFSPKEVISLLNALRKSSIYREDQHSYMLYPNRELKGYLEKNRCSKERLESYPLVENLLSKGDNSLVSRSLSGDIHFNAAFKNRGSLEEEIERYESDRGERVSPSLKEELFTLFEEIFEHKNFTGRSGTFFGYEGLGSIYWHMVSKLLLATQESLFNHPEEGNTVIPLLRERYYDIRRGIGFNKSPSLYGAFPIDPYSHTPWGKGAKQPGMTGQVKEEVMSRFAELGLHVKEGQIYFDGSLLLREEFLKEERLWSYWDLKGQNRSLKLEKNSFGFTFCQVPIIVKEGVGKTVIAYSDGRFDMSSERSCTLEVSRAIFSKRGLVDRLEIFFDSEEIHDLSM